MMQAPEKYVLGPERMSGKFLVLDGIEGTGKSSQVQLLKAYLEQCGNRVVVLRDPGSTMIGEKIRNLLLDPVNTSMTVKVEVLLFMAARAQMMQELILPALAAGQTVICDRFVSSTLAYQSTDSPLDWNDIMAVSRFVLTGPEGWQGPDYTLILDMPVDRAMDRLQRQKDRIEQRPLDYHRQVRAAFLRVPEVLPGTIVNADTDPSSLHARIIQVLAQRFSPASE